ncbi:sigma-54-dependent Fis family transcriptional regulator [Marinobacterium nitratireducens]|uniref:Sigma-54-dependent Fis family transcriptional regulator n=1 Tax=Marinobacterium nitratireducens TaxID=518897 RepID=A0A918DXI9_9GAMM|nr:sigma 54-interacting transcriptional regulator [Marinobacterium nitratireducens]GGO86659.1 sigma-54-dependent Fis family transcriptional regulator [Marinobacterium nitratireducens]
MQDTHKLLSQMLDGGDPSSHLFELLSSLCQGAVAVDPDCRVLWMSDQYRELIGVPPGREVIGRPVEEILPTTGLPRVVRSGKPNFVDLMQINGRWCLVTRLPLKKPGGEVFGAIGFVFYDDLDSIQPLFDKFARLRKRLESENLLRPSRYALDDIIGQSAVMQQLRRQALRAAQLDTTLLLLGETGTGKELLAQGIHNASPRAGAPFVGINMAALPESLVEAELFGAAPGAYTGADRQGRKGKVQLAHGGTLFLDEIAEMPLPMQAKLLRVLQEREVEALGSNRLEQVDVRVIAATAKDLRGLVEQGEFRADLYYRLNVLPIRLPPLRERHGDIALISDRLLSRIQQQANLPALPLSAAARDWLEQYDWPGNVRELHNRLERACVMAEGQAIEPADLGAADDLPRQTPRPRQLGEIRQQTEWEALQEAIRLSGGNKSQAARRLGISRATLYEHLKKYRP